MSVEVCAVITGQRLISIGTVSSGDIEGRALNLKMEPRYVLVSACNTRVCMTSSIPRLFIDAIVRSSTVSKLYTMAPSKLNKHSIVAHKIPKFL
jgi:hypothetical protein